MENVIIAGSGPAGLTAAIYTARAMLAPLVIEGHAPGGQLIVSQEVENFPGLTEAISGMDLMDRFKKQAERFGTRFKMGTINHVRKRGDVFEVNIDSEMIKTKTLIIATGAEARRLRIPTEVKFYGKGISACATCDGSFFRDKEVLVVGGGNTAMEDALFLTRFASKVTIVHRREYLRASSIEVERAKENKKIKWAIPYVLEEITGDKFVSGAILENCQTGKRHEIKCDGIFVAIGHEPKTHIFKDLVNIDENGFIKIETGSTRTSTPGIFACGDVCDPVYKQAVVAAGHGCMAAFDVERYIERIN
ncbi:MAG: thioredoxin-disulfide reductase [Deltaproteobacteria bacterium]|nr:thioredoxin-disulfide reductase [Deltaproteobacteria bacterium]